MSVAIGWHEANQQYLIGALAVVRDSLKRHASQRGGMPEDNAARYEGPDQPEVLQTPSGAMPSPYALEAVCTIFRLTPFERDVLLLCAGVELDSQFVRLCAAAQDSRCSQPTFSLAMAALPEPHWSALSPAAPLRRWRLIEVGSGESLTASPLRIDERILHYLVGVPHLDERVHGLIEPVPPADVVVPSHETAAERIVSLWSHPGTQSWPVIQLCGNDPLGRLPVAAAACAARRLSLHALRANDIPQLAADRDALARLWDREAALAGSALIVIIDDADTAEHLRATVRFVESGHCPILTSGREPLRVTARPSLRVDVNKPDPTEQEYLWRGALGALAARLNGNVKAIAAQFVLSAPTIDAACAQALACCGSEADELGLAVWDACRVQARPRLDDLAQRIEPLASWDVLVLPEPQRQILRQIASQVRQRAHVYGDWGFTRLSARNLGIAALFAGPSGTGKTLAAEVLARELRLDLYRIDLSQVVSKYIGETEKNLRRVFDAAEEGGAILLFDEADALFGKRSEVKDSHDRYANIEISYLLQRMEAYGGLAILTTNMKTAMDSAFLRRLRFVVQFPFPDAVHRAEIWRRMFPPATPTTALDFDRLARLSVAGGNIRNITLNAAFLAADEGQPISMSHLLRAARTEYAKLEKTLTDAEVAGWA